ncbi:MAG: hypothetical protein U0931_13160 [Vulcanimicrobiota bacterium]
MISRSLLWSFVGGGSLAALAFSALELELARRLWLQQGPPLVWALFSLAVLPCLLAGWAVPLAVGYRLSFDRRVPAGLPAGPDYLMAHYRSPFWRGYAALFGGSLLFCLIYLVAGNWWLVAAEPPLLAYAFVRSYRRQARLNQELTVRLKPEGAIIPPFGLLAWPDLRLTVEEELTVTPKRDQLCWWVTVNGHKWKRCELPEHARAIASWLERQRGLNEKV